MNGLRQEGFTLLTEAFSFQQKLILLNEVQSLYIMPILIQFLIAFKRKQAVDVSSGYNWIDYLPEKNTPKFFHDCFSLTILKSTLWDIYSIFRSIFVCRLGVLTDLGTGVKNRKCGVWSRQSLQSFQFDFLKCYRGASGFKTTSGQVPWSESVFREVPVHSCQEVLHGKVCLLGTSSRGSACFLSLPGLFLSNPFKYFI